MELLVLLVMQDIFQVAVVELQLVVVLEEQVVVEKVAMVEPILEQLEQQTLEVVVVEVEQAQLVQVDLV